MNKVLGSTCNLTKGKNQNNRLNTMDLTGLGVKAVLSLNVVFLHWDHDLFGCIFRVPLEKDNSEEFRQRELRAAQLAREIESSPQYRLRIAMENDDGRTEEEKHSAVQRQGSGRESPSLVSR